MKSLRKAMWPTLVVAGLLMFFGAVGGINPQVAYAGDICVAEDDDALVQGPSAIAVGSTHDYWVYVEDGTWEEGQLFDVNLNDETGHSEITSVHGVDISPTNHRNVEADGTGENICGDPDATLRARFVAAIKAIIVDAVENGEDCQHVAGNTICPAGTPPDFDANDQPVGINDEDIDCGYSNLLGGPCVITNTIMNAVAETLATGLLAGNSCTQLRDRAETAVLTNAAGMDNLSAGFVEGQFDNWLLDVGCDLIFDLELDEGEEGIVLVDVTCIRAGIFQLSFANEEATDSASIEVVCGGDVDEATITALPTSVEINPSIANVAHSLVTVNLLDNVDKAATPGTKVTFLTDRCAIESSAVDTEDEFEGAETLFRANNALNPATAAAIESSVYATTAPDGASRQQEEVTSFRVTGSAGSDFAQRTIAAVILHCDPIHMPGVTPGPAVITAVIDRGSINNFLVADNDDLVLRTTVTVIGPPAANGVTVTAAPSTLACGEKATITVDVKDSVGQPVSDHTWVEAVTNAGGVLAGTGAVAGQQGLVSPVSSTVAETFGGKATLYLLTSTAHVGKYEVVITTGGGGGVTGQLVNGGVTTNLLGGLFTTAPISVQVTVECTVAAATAPAPVATAPRAGQGITPPSTGDAGLASSNSSILVLFAIAGAVAVIAAGFTLKVVRNED